MTPTATEHAEQMYQQAFDALEGNPISAKYADRHGIESAKILTIYDDERASLVAEYVQDRIEGKTVVEIGGGMGLLAFHLSEYAERVFVIEAEPAWSWIFLGTLYARKPKNVTYIFGAADEVVGDIGGDVALFCTHSAHEDMAKTAALFAPVVIDVYAELIPLDTIPSILLGAASGGQT